MDTRSQIILALTAVYFAGTVLVGYLMRRSVSSGSGFTSGGKTFPTFLIAALLVSESIGSSVSIGTAQTGYSVGVSAAWNLIALGMGFLLLGFFLVNKYKAMGHITISAVLRDRYGPGMRYAASILTILSLGIVAVALYAGGGAVLASLTGTSKSTAIWLAGIVTVFYVAMGGMRSVIYTNFANAIMKYVGVLLALAYALSWTGGIGHLQESVPMMFGWMNVGISQIVAWTIAGVGAMFAAQYIIQGLMITETDKQARWSCYYVFVLMVPYGIAVALIGVCAAFLYPGIKSINAFPEVIAHMPALPASIVVVGLTGSMLGGISACTLSSATMLLNDFYMPFFNKSGDKAREVRFARAATVFCGVVPLILAIYVDQVLAVAFLGKSLRASLAVFILLAFYAPNLGTPKGAVVGVLMSLVGTIGWFLAGNPYGIDSTYIAFLCPLVAVVISHAFKPRGPAHAKGLMTMK